MKIILWLLLQEFLGISGDGGWTSWTAYRKGSCSVSCDGAGVRFVFLSRNCSNPEGSKCVGREKVNRTELCYRKNSCPDNTHVREYVGGIIVIIIFCLIGSVGMYFLRKRRHKEIKKLRSPGRSSSSVVDAQTERQPQRSKEKETQRSKEKETQRLKDIEPQRSKETETQRPKDSEPQRSKEKETQRLKDSETQRSKESETQRSKESETQRSKESEPQRSKDSQAQRSKQSESQGSKENQTPTIKVNTNEAHKDDNTAPYDIEY